MKQGKIKQTFFEAEKINWSSYIRKSMVSVIDKVE